MNEKQKFFALLGIVSIVAFISVGIATDDWISEWWTSGYIGSGRFTGNIAWHSFIPFLLAVGSGVGWFLYKDK